MQDGDRWTARIAFAQSVIGALVALAAASAGAAPSIPPIVVSVPNGIAPQAVHFDATGTTDSAFPRPFHSLDYQWSFGDPASGTWTHSGRSKNHATGAVGVHLYETPGTYEVTLTVTNPRGESATRTTTVTVNDPSTQFPDSVTYCYANPGRAFTGCPRPCPSANCVTTTSIEEGIAARLEPGTRHYLRRGDTFTMNQSLFISGDNGGRVMIAAFGSGPKPVVATNLPGEATLGIAAQSDWRVGELTLAGSRGIALATQGQSRERVTFWDIDATGYNICSSVSGYGHDLVAMHDFTCTQLRQPSASGMWLVFDHANRASYQGLLVEGIGNPNANGLFRTVGTTRSVISHNRLVAYENLGVMSVRSCGAGTQPGCTAGMPNRYLQISDNQLVAASAIPIRTCTVNSCAATGNDGNDAIDFIWERNHVSLAATGTAANFVWWIQGGDQTFRNNVIDLTGGQVASAARVILEQFGPTSPGGGNRDRLHFVNNTIVATSALPELVACGFANSGGTGHQCHNNLMYAPLATRKTIAENADWAETNNLANYTPAFPFEANLPALGARELDDFQLAANSAAVDAGFDLDGTAPAFVATDAFQGCRAAGDAWDVGAHERNAIPCFVPEPGSLALGCAAMGVLAGVGARRRSRSCAVTRVPVDRAAAPR